MGPFISKSVFKPSNEFDGCYEKPVETGWQTGLTRFNVFSVSGPEFIRGVGLNLLILSRFQDRFCPLFKRHRSVHSLSADELLRRPAGQITRQQGHAFGQQAIHLDR